VITLIFSASNEVAKINIRRSSAVREGLSWISREPWAMQASRRALGDYTNGARHGEVVQFAKGIRVH
jgi:hypothetical protein